MMSETEAEVCVDCGKHAPPTDTNYTLISQRYGWRLLRERLANNDYRVEWRCPECWRAYKEARGGPPSSARSATRK